MELGEGGGVVPLVPARGIFSRGEFVRGIPSWGKKGKILAKGKNPVYESFLFPLFVFWLRICIFWKFSTFIQKTTLFNWKSRGTGTVGRSQLGSNACVEGRAGACCYNFLSSALTTSPLKFSFDVESLGAAGILKTA